MYRQSEKNLLSSGTSSTCPRNMVLVELCPANGWVRFGSLGRPCKFRVLAVLLHGTLVVGISQTLQCWTEGRHLYSAGQPSRWTLAHILVVLELWPNWPFVYNFIAASRILSRVPCEFCARPLPRFLPPLVWNWSFGITLHARCLSVS